MLFSGVGYVSEPNYLNELNNLVCELCGFRDTLNVTKCDEAQWSRGRNADVTGSLRRSSGVTEVEQEVGGVTGDV